jgi:hypothetical protein
VVPTVVYEPGVVEMTAVKVGPVVSFKERTVVFEVETIPVVTIPGRVVIVGITGEIGFTNSRSGIIAIGINRYGCGSDHDTGGRNPKSYVCTDEYLGITFGSDEAGGYNGGEDK